MPLSCEINIGAGAELEENGSSVEAASAWETRYCEFGILGMAKFSVLRWFILSYIVYLRTPAYDYCPARVVAVDKRGNA